MKPILTLALARPTFDVPFAEQLAAQAFSALDTAGASLAGPRDLLFDANAAREAIAKVEALDISGILLLQVTFTDASMTVEIAKAFPGVPLALWAFPEPRAGGRLRLNSFCGLNLAVHALGRADVPHSTLYASPEKAELAALLAGLGKLQSLNALPARPAHDGDAGTQAAARALDMRMKNRRIGLVGEHPAGFETCRYDAAQLSDLTGAIIEKIALPEIFERARAVDAEKTARRLAEARATYRGLEGMDGEQLDKSLQLYDALDGLKQAGNLDAFAVRCWPETFTDYGCAICGPMGMMGEAGTPCACEADVLGALTTLLMQEAGSAPAWLVDIVDMDAASDTGVFWHCGSAPLSMRDPQCDAEAQIHSNRRMPLLAQFTLKPGRITIARLSQTRNRLTLVLGSGEVIRAPMSFTGTSATVRFDGGVSHAQEILIGERLEHHVAMLYGDHRATLEAWAALKGLPVLDLTPAEGTT